MREKAQNNNRSTSIRDHIISQTESKKTRKRKELFKIIDVGVDVSNFGDASEWQRKTRKDRIIAQSHDSN